jgi:signal transduction histidine kinase
VHLSERFFRPDRARGRDKGGFGLGLSITKAYMRVLGGRLIFEPGRPRGSVFCVVLPKVGGNDASSAPNTLQLRAAQVATTSETVG